MLVRTEGLQKSAAPTEPQVTPLTVFAERGAVMQSAPLALFTDSLPALTANTAVTVDGGKLEGSWIKVSGTGPDVLTFNREDDTLAMFDGRGKATNFTPQTTAAMTTGSIEVVSTYRNQRTSLPTNVATRVNYAVSGNTLSQTTETKQTGRAFYVVGPFSRAVSTTSAETVYVRHDPSKDFPELRDKAVKSSGDAVIDKLEASRATKERGSTLRTQLESSTSAYAKTLESRKQARIEKLLKSPRAEALMKAVEFECPSLKSANKYNEAGLTIDLGLSVLGDGQNYAVYLARSYERSLVLLTGNSKSVAPGGRDIDLDPDMLRKVIDTLTEGLAEGTLSAETIANSAVLNQSHSKKPTR